MFIVYDPRMIFIIDSTDIASVQLVVRYRPKLVEVQQSLTSS